MVTNNERLRVAARTDEDFTAGHDQNGPGGAGWRAQDQMTALVDRDPASPLLVITDSGLAGTRGLSVPANAARIEATTHGNPEEWIWRTSSPEHFSWSFESTALICTDVSPAQAGASWCITQHGCPDHVEATISGAPNANTIGFGCVIVDKFDLEPNVDDQTVIYGLIEGAAGNSQRIWLRLPFQGIIRLLEVPHPDPDIGQLSAADCVLDYDSATGTIDWTVGGVTITHVLSAEHKAQVDEVTMRWAGVRINSNAATSLDVTTVVNDVVISGPDCPLVEIGVYDTGAGAPVDSTQRWVPPAGELAVDVTAGKNLLLAGADPADNWVTTTIVPMAEIS